MSEQHKSQSAVKQWCFLPGRVSFPLFSELKSQLDSLCASSHLYPSVTLPSAAEPNKQACQEERIGRGVKLFALNEKHAAHGS